MSEELELENEDYGLSSEELSLLETTSDIPDGKIDYSDFNDSNSVKEDEKSEDTKEEVKKEEETQDVEKTDEDTNTPSLDDRKVPLSALHQEREQRRQWRDKANELQGQLNLIMQSLQNNNSVQHKEQEQQEVYDPKTHPLEYIQQQMSQFHEAKRQMDEYNRRQSEAIKNQQIEQQVVTTWSRAVEEEKAVTPDVEEATKYLIETRSNQLREFGLNSSQIESQLRNEVIQLVYQGQHMGINPARMAFNMAKASGYRGVDHKPVQDKIQEASNQIKQAEKARQATRTLAAVSGSPASDDMTLEVLDQMSEREFNKWIEKNPRQYEKLLMTAI